MIDSAKVISPDFPDDGEHYWVIPHGHTLDYCPVTLSGGSDKHGKLKVTGYRSKGWRPNGGFVRTSVAEDKLTNIPEWHTAFLALYDDPHWKPKPY